IGSVGSKKVHATWRLSYTFDISMANDRLNALNAMLAQDPKNTLVRYGLAMEYMNSGELETAVSEFRKLIELKPEYAAAYYHGGQTLEKLDRLDDARDLYREGIEITTR